MAKPATKQPKPKKPKPDPLPGEIEWLKTYAIPLLRQLGFVRVDFLHGPGEMGKDLVFAELDRFGLLRYYAAQAKREVVTAKDGGREFEALVTQLRSAYDYKYKDSSSGRTVGISGVYLLTIQRVNEHVKERLTERTGTWLHFVDADQLEIAKHTSAWPHPRERVAVYEAIMAEITIADSWLGHLRAACREFYTSGEWAFPNIPVMASTLLQWLPFVMMELGSRGNPVRLDAVRLHLGSVNEQIRAAPNNVNIRRHFAPALDKDALGLGALLRDVWVAIRLLRNEHGEWLTKSYEFPLRHAAIGVALPWAPNPNPDKGGDQPATPEK
ncbi:MAG: hypothetical protein J0L92_03450 [Deltaproteobacteria bacterium]|nr:hypothetical protein [Deltaproteobacteria bacterium]